MMCKQKLKSLCLLLIFIQFGMGVPYLEHDGQLAIDIQHGISLENFDKFSYRGNVTIMSLNTGFSNVIQNPLTREEQDLITAMAIKNEFYRIKATVLYSDGHTRTFLTSNTACALLKAQLKDAFWVSIDGSGYVNAITYSIPQNNVDLNCSNINPSELLAKQFSTDVFVKHTELAPVPDTISYIQKLEREREAREKGENKDNRGFFAKYWMYIVPVVIFMFISGATNHEQSK